jgi:TonB family protein
MTAMAAHSFAGNVFSVHEIARAAHVLVPVVHEAMARAGISPADGFVPGPDAARLVRLITRASAATTGAGAPTSIPRRRRNVSLVCSGTIHALLLAALLAANSLGLLRANDTDQDVKDKTPAHLVFLISPGPGGGGGGGGLQVPLPPARAELKTVVKKKVSSPVPPPVRRPVPPPVVRSTPPVLRPAPPPVVVPAPALPVETKAAPPAVQAPVVPVAADPVDTPGTLAEHAAQTPSAGPGNGGGIGTGSGTGLGEGRGSGIGDGSGGGTGGGPYRPGTGIAPPTLIREIKPDYTAEARRRAIEGDVVLEIIVRRDGTVGNVRVLQTLAAGLEQKAIEAVRQWRFAPATRHGTAVDVVVEVSASFKLR